MNHKTIRSLVALTIGLAIFAIASIAPARVTEKQPLNRNGAEKVIAAGARAPASADAGGSVKQFDHDTFQYCTIKVRDYPAAANPVTASASAASH